MQKRIFCPGEKQPAKGGTLIVTPQTRDTYGTKTGECQICGKRYDVKPGGVVSHILTITIHDSNRS